MHRCPVFRYGRHVLLAALTVLACGGKPQVRISPGYHSASLKRILILPVTGVTDMESEFMTSIISQAFEVQGKYEVIVYKSGQSKEFDDIMALSRKVNGAIPLDVIPELGRRAKADAVIVTHQSTITPAGGVSYRFESQTGAAIRNRKTNRPPRSSDTDEAAGFTPVDINFPSGLTRMQMLETASIQRLWETQKEIETASELQEMIERIPPQSGE